MLRQEQGGFDVPYLELLQQSLQLWHLGSRNVPRGLGEGVKFLQLHGQVGEVRRIGDDPVIINDRDALPALHTELFLRVQQLCLCCGKIQCHRARIANVGMQSEREPEEVSRLSRQCLLDRRRGCQFAIPQHIQTAHKNAVFTAPHHSSNAGEVQHLEHLVGYAVQFGDKVVFRIEAAKLGVIRGIHHMIAVCFCADRQIPQILQRDDTAVGVYFSLHLHGKQSLKGGFLHLVQRRQQRGKVVELDEADIQPVQIGREVPEGFVVFDLHVQLLALVQPHFFHSVPQFPRGGGQVQLGIRLVVGYVFFRKIYLEYLLTQGSSLPSSSHSAHGV